MFKLAAAANHAQAGAVVVFSGNVRNHHEGRGVLYLEYEAQEELAESQIKAILGEARERWGLHYAHAIHRLGRVEIAEASVLIVVSASHRGEAYEASRYIIDEIKERAPIWKKEFFEEGDSTWR